VDLLIILICRTARPPDIYDHQYILNGIIIDLLIIYNYFCHQIRSSAPTWEKTASLLLDDGHTWRKYGQKMITNAKYFRYLSIS